MPVPATSDTELWTIFNLYRAHVVAGFITWDVEPNIERRDAAEVDILRYPIAWVNCDKCHRRLEFQIQPTTKIALPWEVGGWRIDWRGEDGITVLCPKEV